MNKQENISFENILKEYENNSKTKKRIRKLANIEENKVSPLVVKGVEEFRKLVNRIKDKNKSL
jgi:hypothetical protein